MTEIQSATAKSSRAQASSQTGGADDGLPVPRRYWSLTAIWLAMAMAVLDGVIANIALPTIAQQLGVSPAAAIWVINAYQIAIVMLLLPLAALGEIVGYRRVYSTGLALFVLASVGCALSNNLTQLVACRFVQGVGAAAVMAINGALIRLTFPSKQLGRGLGYNAVIVSIAAAAGPTLAAGILAATSWHWLFAVNVPIGLASLVIGIAALPVSTLVKRRFDWRSTLLNAAAFAALFIAVNDVVEGRLELSTALPLVIAAAAGAALVSLARSAADPLIPLDLLRIPVLLRSYSASLCAFAAQMIGLVALPFYLQNRFGYGHLATGLLITGFPFGVAIAAPFSGWLADRSSGRIGAIGLVLFALGYGLLSMAPSSAPVWVFACLTLSGIGIGLFQSPNNRLMLSEAPRRRSGAAAGMMAISRVLGQTVGAVVAALIFRFSGTSSITPFVVAAALGILAVAVGLKRSENHA